MATSLTTRAAAPCLSIIDGIVTTLSTHVAVYFGKAHDDVLKAIRALIAQLSPDRLGNFAETVTERRNPSGGEPIKSPAYRLTRDGFTLLAMGFTGKRALQFKLAYIDAFNRMEAELREKQPKQPTWPADAQMLDMFTTAIQVSTRLMAEPHAECFLVKRPRPFGKAEITALADDVQITTWPALIQRLRHPDHMLPLPLAQELARAAAWQAQRMAVYSPRGRGAELAEQLRREKLPLADLHELLVAAMGEQNARVYEMCGPEAQKTLGSA